jgi:putative nucleotidyltransferase with HDIG domain
MPSGRAAPTQIAPRTERWLPHAVVATAFVVVLPALVVWKLVPHGQPALLALSVPLGMLLSVLAAAVGGAIWKRVPGSRDLVFADLMLWGWLRRLRAERRLKHAEKLLGDGAEGLSVQALSSLSSLLEARDSFTYGHSQRVTRHAERIAAEMGLPPADVARVRTAAALHDVGKLHTPRDILNKPGRLTDEEFEVIRRHPVDGAAMSGSLADPAITAMIRHHHERLDGAGYPDGLAGTAIPLGARIIAVADTFDAMTSNRAYRRAASHKRAFDVLRSESGAQLDAGAVAAFVGYYRGRRAVAWSAFATAAPQRLFAWLGSVSPGVSAGVAGAAALAIGVSSPQPPVVTPTAEAAVPRQVAKRAQAAAPVHHPALGDDSAGSERPATRTQHARSRSVTRRRSGSKHGPSHRGAPAAKPRKVNPVKVQPRAAEPQTATPQSVKPQKVKPPKAKPPKAKPQKATPPAAQPPTAKPPKAKPPKATPPAAKPPKAKPQKATPPAAKPPKAKPPKATLPVVVVPTPAPPKVKPPKIKPPKA